VGAGPGRGGRGRQGARRARPRAASVLTSLSVGLGVGTGRDLSLHTGGGAATGVHPGQLWGSSGASLGSALVGQEGWGCKRGGGGGTRPRVWERCWEWVWRQCRSVYRVRGGAGRGGGRRALRCGLCFRPQRDAAGVVTGAFWLQVRVKGSSPCNRGLLTSTECHRSCDRGLLTPTERCRDCSRGF